MNNDRGVAMLFALATLAVLTILSAVLFAAIQRSSGRIQNAAARARVLNRAESGVEIAIAKLAAGRSWGGAKGVGVPGGQCDLVVKPDGANGYRITSTSVSSPEDARASWTFALQVRLRQAKENRFRVVAWSGTWR